MRPNRFMVAAIIAALTVGVTSCSEPTVSDSGESDAICVNKATRERVADSLCESPVPSGVIWWYLLAGQTAPAYGQRVQAGSASSPPGRVARGRVPDGGGHARRPMPVIGGGKPPRQDVRRAPAPRPPAARR